MTTNIKLFKKQPIFIMVSIASLVCNIPSVSNTFCLVQRILSYSPKSNSGVNHCPIFSEESQPSPTHPGQPYSISHII